MKQFLNFSNRGNQLLGAWISFILLFIVPYIWVVIKMSTADFASGEGYEFIPVVLALVLLAIFIEFYIFRFFITGIQYREKNLEFNGKFGDFVGIILLNLLLTIITIGIYYPWFVKKLYNFFINNSKYEESEFNFLSKGGELLLIFVFAAVIPMILVALIASAFVSIANANEAVGTNLINLFTYIFMAPYLYLLYRWLVNIQYKEYTILWKTEFFSSVGMIIGQIVLTIITIGIYSPAAALRIYKYFANKTYLISDGKSKKFGFENKMVNDFLFIWGQNLLILITASIYLPWAMAKISHRVLSQTYITEEISELSH